MSLRYSKPLAFVTIVLGVLLLLTGLVVEGNLLNLFIGVVLGLLGVLMTINPIVAVEEGEARIKSPLGFTVRRFPVAGPADLRIDGNKLLHAPTGKRIASLGLGTDKASADEWHRWVAAA